MKSTTPESCRGDEGVTCLHRPHIENNKTAVNVTTRDGSWIYCMCKFLQEAIQVQQE